MAKSDEADIVVRLRSFVEGGKRSSDSFLSASSAGRNLSKKSVSDSVWLPSRLTTVNERFVPRAPEKRDTDSRNPGIGSPATHVTSGEKTATLVRSARTMTSSTLTLSNPLRDQFPVYHDNRKFVE